MLPIAITPGDPSGIGIDIVLMAHQRGWLEHTIVIADQQLLSARAQQLGLNLAGLRIFNVPLNVAIKAGEPNPASARYILQTLDVAVAMILNQQCSALVTGPVNKATINRNGVQFAGHTQYFAKKTNTHPVMIFVSPGFKLALLTDHIPLIEVPKALNSAALTHCIQTIHQGLQQYFACPQPRIWVCGLNPHAGEDGYLGVEEQNIMIPTLTTLRKQGILIQGPLGADIAFTDKILKEADIILTMYHDQGLPVLKAQGMHEAVNVTLGLPFIRTSVDHGTAYDIAGTGQADPNSMGAAIRCAKQMLKNKQIYGLANDSSS